MKYAWLTSLRGLYPKHGVYLLRYEPGSHTFRFVEPWPLDGRMAMYVDLNLSDKLLDCLVEGDGFVRDFIIESVASAKGCRFPSPENDPR